MRKNKLLLLIGALLSTCFIKTNSSELPGTKAQDRPKFILITFLYNETDPIRIKEYITCLDNNLKQNAIEKIHILYDTTKDAETQNHIIFDFLVGQEKIVVSTMKGRPTYGQCFDLANQLYPNRKIILSNADIYFNESLYLLEQYDLENKFLALTRWNLHDDETIRPYYKKKSNGTLEEWPYSQDVWIFKTPLRKFKQDNFSLGKQGCDLRIAYWAKKSGLCVINPCLSIQCIHVHFSGIRHYEPLAHPHPHDMSGTHWSELY